MQILNLVQGTAPWHAHRASHWNASDAPAMMGCSPYKTRSQLLREQHFGISAVVDEHQQRRFDAGHLFEALARPLAEKIIGEDLYPVTGSDGWRSASFDGLTLDGRLSWEHKTLNEELRAAMPEGCTGADLPLHNRVQMEHQLMVSGAERVLFMASTWNGEKLVEERHCWYTPDLALREKIVCGWSQFERDREAYVPPVAAPVVVATPVETLPAVSVRMDGALSVVSNLDRFGVALRAYVERIPATPTTDQEFADTEAACKALKQAEDALDAAESGALASISCVEEMRRMVADLRALARSTRLASEKLVERRKGEIKEGIVTKARAAFAAHVAALNDEAEGLLVMHAAPDFAAAAKNKRTLASLQDAVDTALAHGKIAADAAAREIRARLAVLTTEGGDFGFLFADRAALVQKPIDDLRLVIRSRIQAHEAAQALQERRHKEAEAQQELQRIEAEAQQAHRQAEAGKLAIEAMAKAAAPTPAPRVMPAPAVAEPATLKLGDISERLGFTVTGAFLVALGFKPAAVEKRAVLYRHSDFQRICTAIAHHVMTLGEMTS